MREDNFTKLPPGTKVFDAFNYQTKPGINLKTLNTQTPARLSDPRKIGYQTNRHVKDVKKFKGIHHRRCKSVDKADILTSELYIVVPKETTYEQWLEIAKAVKKGEEQGIKFTFWKGK